MIPLPTAAPSREAIALALDRATPADRIAWVRSLGARQQRRLYAMCAGSPVEVDELVRDGVVYVRHIGKNALPMFHHFEKRMTRHERQVVGYNETAFPAPFRTIASWVTGPGHFTAYPSPEVPGEVWFDYRRVPEHRAEGFPPLQSNERGLPALVFGDMVDVVRRVSEHVVVGDAFKGRFPRADRPPLLVRVGRLLPTASFVMCQEAAP